MTVFNKFPIRENGIWDVNKENALHLFDKDLSKFLCDFLKKEKAKSVVDIGCGLADYSNEIKKIGIDVFCYDGNPKIKENNGIIIKNVDLSKKCYMQICDWALCIEVGEHIPKKYEENFIDNLHRSNKNGIILSWAIEGQGGDGHVNCKNNIYIKKIFNSLGYSNDIIVEKEIRKNSIYSWFKNTIMIFRKG